MSSFSVGVPALDYLTITTWDRGELDTVRDRISGEFIPLGPRKVMQYDGATFSHETGNVWLGVGKQGGRSHYMVRADGLCANAVFFPIVPEIERGAGVWSTTRIDLQITMPYDRQQWSQWRLFNRLKRSGTSTVSYTESKQKGISGMLATVYCGSRKSDRYVRVYEKVGLGTDVYLRFEVEYKGKRAKAVASRIAREGGKGYELGGMEIVGSLLLFELQRIGDAQLQEIFTAPLMDLSPVRPKVIRAATKTERWLMEDVIPIMARYISEDGRDGRVAQEIVKLAGWIQADGSPDIDAHGIIAGT